jgi:hypothetical protein
MKLPAWALAAEKNLREASKRVRMIAATTPVDLDGHLRRLQELWQAGNQVAPFFDYPASQDHSEIIDVLQHLADALENEGPLGLIYAARAREIATEAAVCSAVGTPALRPKARQRFCRRDDFDRAADELAQGWLDERFSPSSQDAALKVRSDDPRDPRSLLVRLREEMGRRKIPFRVVVARDSSALAATGESFVQIAQDRIMTVADVERTVLHEIEGHVLPRCRANTQPIGIFALGTRFGVDDQEGRALWLERRAGHLSFQRRRELAFRHLAARMLEENADFVETARALAQRGATLTDTLRITSRVYRGGGLGREVVYLPAFLRVDAALAKDPTVDDVLGAGRVAVEAVEVLRPLMTEMF